MTMQATDPNSLSWEEVKDMGLAPAPADLTEDDPTDQE